MTKYEMITTVLSVVAIFITIYPYVKNYFNKLKIEDHHDDKIMISFNEAGPVTQFTLVLDVFNKNVVINK